MPVSFRAFQGIAPRRYEAAFEAGVRKNGEVAVGLDRQAAPHATAWREVAVRDQEDRTITAFEAILRDLQESGESVEDEDAKQDDTLLSGTGLEVGGSAS